MKKYIIIALSAFIIGALAAAYLLINTNQDAQPLLTEESGENPALSSTIYASPNQQKASLDFATIAENVSPAVVYIEADRVERQDISGFQDSPLEDFWRRFFDEQPRERERKSTASGTGFFISSDGYLITNNHIVENAVAVRVVTLTNDRYSAEIVGTDPETDLALCRVDEENLSFVSLGSSEALKVGEWVLAIGNPLGLTHTVTAGIVSAKGRLIEGLDVVYQDFIQTDAAINRGNSGGPLINMEGEVIGINTLIFAPTGGNIGIGFSISSDLAKNIVEKLKKDGRVIRGYIGITVSDIDNDTQQLLKLDSKEGALVNYIEEDMPAEKAGLKQYDVITSIDGHPIRNRNDLFFKVADAEPGKKIDFEIVRDGKRQVVEIKVTEKESSREVETHESSGQEIGLSVAAMNQRLARRYGYKTEEGLIITEVQRGSEAQRRGLQVGDIILEANRKKMEDTGDLEKIVKATDPGEAIILLVRRENRRGDHRDFIVTIRIPE